MAVDSFDRGFSGKPGSIHGDFFLQVLGLLTSLFLRTETWGSPGSFYCNCLILSKGFTPLIGRDVLCNTSPFSASFEGSLYRHSYYYYKAQAVKYSLQEKKGSREVPLYKLDFETFPLVREGFYPRFAMLFYNASPFKII